MNWGSSDCERGGCDDEARRLSISAAICDGGATKSARSPRHKMNRDDFSTGSGSSKFSEKNKLNEEAAMVRRAVAQLMRHPGMRCFVP